ncbi:MAG: hypothetical protein HY756_03810 [Nitrospirae bacterium]|nr:hypothetical protein [Nitrospirota bacterium]
MLETKAADVDDAAHVRSLIKRSLTSLNKHEGEVLISASEEDLNAVAVFMARGIRRLDGRVNITPSGLEAFFSLRLPHNPIGSYINLYIRVIPSQSEFKIAEFSIGRVKIPGSVALYLLRLAMDGILGDKQGTNILNSVQSVLFEQSTVTVRFKHAPCLNLVRDSLKERLSGVRDYFSPLGNPQTIRIYYRELADIGMKHQDNQKVSLAVFIGPLFNLALQRSLEADPAEENHAAIMALAIYAGHYRFGNLVGPVVDEKTRLLRLKTANITLGGREDLRLHFVISAGLKLVAESGMSHAVGEFKELMDAARGGSGFSFADLAADRAGVRFAEAATDRKGGARRLQMLFANGAFEGMFFPLVAALPEGITQKEFQYQYGNVEDPGYRALVEKIDNAINKLPAYSER